MPIHAPKIGRFGGFDPLNGEPYQQNPQKHIVAQVRTSSYLGNGSTSWAVGPLKQVAQLSQRDRATQELFRFAKLRSGIFEPPFGDLGER